MPRLWRLSEAVWIDTIQQWKMQEIWNSIHKPTTLFRRELQTMNARAARVILSSNVMFIRFADQNLTIFCVKWPWNGFRFSWKYWCCMRSTGQTIKFFKTRYCCILIDCAVLSPLILSVYLVLKYIYLLCI